MIVLLKFHSTEQLAEQHHYVVSAVSSMKGKQG